MGLAGIDEEVTLADGALAGASGGVIIGADTGGRGGRPVIDAIGVEKPPQLGHLGRVLSRREHVATVRAEWRLDVALVVVGKFLHQFTGPADALLDRAQAGLVVVLNAVSQGERVAEAGQRSAAGAATAPLLVGHADGPVVERPGVPIGGVEQVKHLAGEVQRAPSVKPPGVVGADVLLALPLPWADDLVKGLRSRSEVVGRIDALLVEVDVDLRHPVAVGRHPALGLHLGLPRPVAVHVKHEVVAASARPGLVVLHGAQVGIWRQARRPVLEGHIAIPPIRVDARVDEDHGLIEPSGHIAAAGILSGHQGVHGAQGSLRAHGFIAVDVVAQVNKGNAGVIGGQPLPFRAGEVGLTQRLEPGVVGLGSHDEQTEIPVLRGPAIRHPDGAVRAVGQRLGIVDHLVVSGEPVAQFIAKELRRSLDLGLNGKRKKGCGSQPEGSG